MTDKPFVHLDDVCDEKLAAIAKDATLHKDMRAVARLHMHARRNRLDGNDERARTYERYAYRIWISLPWRSRWVG